ncbi:threonine synthase [Gudongella sp. DL1XJH-153]|uniref:threonine synthase n=1 Tax=Gudongella sp. DL1XJH-153 TaxID=3409804 RepID=UPI003BB7CA0D
MNFYCSKCNHEESIDTRKAKCECGGLWKLRYDAPKFDLDRIHKDKWGLLRYREWIPVEKKALGQVSLGEGMTPAIHLDEDVMLKMDYLMPTLSFKDRGAAVLIAHVKSIGVDYVVQDSSGNAGNSVAAYSAKAGIECEIFVPEGTSPKKIDMISSHGAKVNLVPGSRDNCADVCRKRVEEEGVYYASHVFNPFFYQGTKTYIYEVYEQLNRIPENLFLPLGNGTLFLGIMIGLEELLQSGLIERMPNIYAVQGENCAPFAETVEAGEKEIRHTTPKQTMAEGIAIGAPMRGDEILEYIYKYNIRVITAPEDGIIPARERLAKKGIYIEHTTAATYAAYLKLIEQEGRLRDVLIPMCGAGLKSDH